MSASTITDKLSPRLGPAIKFISWWRGEMLGLAALVMGDRLRRRRDSITVEVGDDKVLFALRSDGAAALLGAMDLGEDKLNAGVRQAISAGKAGGQKLALRLPSSLGLTKTLSFPFAAESNLDQVVSFEVSRQTPFKADQVYCGHRLVKRDDKAKTLKVHLTVVPKNGVERQFAALKKWGLVPDSLELFNRDGDTEGTIELHPSEHRGHGAGGWLRRHRLAAAALVALLAALIIVPLIGKRGTEVDLASRIEAVRAEALAASAIRNDIRDLMGRNSFLHSHKRKVPAMTALLNEVTRLLPDSSWLNRLEVHDGEIQIHGNSPQASALIEILERSPYLSNVRFRSPVTRDARTSNERFHISADVAAGVIPGVASEAGPEVIPEATR